MCNIISPTAARTRKRRPDILLGPYIKDLPSVFFRKKMSNSRHRTFCLGISTFFRGVPPRVGAAQRQKKNGVLARDRAVFNEIERGFLWRNRWLELPTMHTQTHTHPHTRREPLYRRCHCRCWRPSQTVGTAKVRERPALLAVVNDSAMAARRCAQGERGVRSQEFERWQSHLISSRNVLPDAKSRWPGGSRTAARPAASRSWGESTLAARAEHTRSYTLRSVHSTRRTRLPAGRRAHLRAAERRQARRRRSSKWLAHSCTAAASSHCRARN